MNRKRWAILTLGLTTAWLLRWKFACWFMGLATYHWLARVILPRVRWRLKKPSLDSSVEVAGRVRAQAGDIVLTYKSGYLGSALTPGYWKHAALVTRGCEPGRSPQVAEMTAEGFGLIGWIEVCQADRVAIFRCCEWDDNYKRTVVVPRCRSFRGKAYDTAFKLGVASLYCSELVYEADTERRLDVDLSDLRGLGRQYVSPQDIAEAGNVVKVWDSEGS